MNILNDNTESNPFIPDNLNEYIDWESNKNEETGIIIWHQKEIKKPNRKYNIKL